MNWSFLVAAVTFAWLLRSTSGIRFKEPAKSLTFRAEVASLARQKFRYRDHSIYIDQLSSAVNRARSVDLSALYNTTLLLPTNKAISDLHPKLRFDRNVISKLLAYHSVGQKLQFSDFVPGRVYYSRRAPPLVSSSCAIYAFGLTRPPSSLSGLYFSADSSGFSPAVVPSNSRFLYSGASFNCIGVNRVILPPGFRF